MYWFSLIQGIQPNWELKSHGGCVSSCEALQPVVGTSLESFARRNSTLSNVWPLPGTSFNMAFNCPPAAGPTASTYWANENHAIMEPQVVQQLIVAIAWLQYGQNQVDVGGSKVLYGKSVFGE